MYILLICIKILLESFTMDETLFNILFAAINNLIYDFNYYLILNFVF